VGKLVIVCYNKSINPRQDFMAPNRPKSPKERRDAKNARSFIGRTEQQDQFQRSLLQPEHQEAKLIFSISGQGGVGKTTLLKEFRRIAEEYGHVVAYVDEGAATNRVDDVPEAMHRLAEDLEGQGFKFEKFRERYKAYRVKKQEMEADPEAPKGFVGDATRGVMKIALEAGKTAVPFGSMIDSEMVASKAGELMNYGVERFRNKDEERLIKETLEVLTPLFLEGVKRIPVEKTLVLMLDTYEVTGGFLDEWVRGLLDEDYGELERSILLCIGGREPIDKNAWDEWEGMIARSPLEPFTREEAEAFLASKQIKSAAVIEEIWRLSSEGLPLLVSMMAAAAPTSVDAVVDSCEDAVNRFLVWETDAGKRDLAQDAACARVLNADVVAALGEGSFEWLRGCAFVLRDGGQWRYHLVVREQMLRYLGQKSPKRLAEVHGKLAVYYDGLRNGLGLEVGKEAKDKTWREYSLEWIYHELSAAPQAKLRLALNGFVQALRYSSVFVFAQAWAKVILQVGQEANCETLRKWGNQLEDASVAYQEGRHQDLIIVFVDLIQSNQVEPEMKAIAYTVKGSAYFKIKEYVRALEDFNYAIQLDDTYHPSFAWRGHAYRALKRYEEALKDLDRAIELKPEYAWAIAFRGQTYRTLKRYEEALKDFDRAIELDNKYSWAIASRGQTYQALKRYEEALKDFDRTIELDSKHAWAIASRGQTYRLMKRYEEALKDFDLAIELDDSEYSWAIASRGQTHRALKRYEEALKDFDRAIELDSEDRWAIRTRGDIYLQTNQIEKAIQDFDRSITLDLEKAEWACYLRALAYLKLNQPEPAETDFQKAISVATAKYEKDQIDYQNTFNLALYHLAAGHHEESDRLYTSSLTAPIEWLQMAIDDLNDYLQLFPDCTIGQQSKQRLQAAIQV
jgi:tetratricopeptide (TPR) repeat protein